MDSKWLAFDQNFSRYFPSNTGIDMFLALMTTGMNGLMVLYILTMVLARI